MASKVKVHHIALILLLVFSFGVQACGPQGTATTVVQSTANPQDIPTWTPRPGSADIPTHTPTAAATVTPAATATGAPTTTTEPVTVQAANGNVNIRRGPSIYYNFVSVLKAGQTVIADGRDFKGDWVRVTIPGNSGTKGWISLLTDYTVVSGDVENLPQLDASPAVGASIRNCTNHTLLVMPWNVELTKKSLSPYNEEQFGPGVYQVYDLDVDTRHALTEVTVSEGHTVDIIIDGTGTKSKCE